MIVTRAVRIMYQRNQTKELGGVISKKICHLYPSLRLVGTQTDHPFGFIEQDHGNYCC